MKKLSALLLSFRCLALASAQTELNVMTFNIRYDNAGDSLNAWQYRKQNAAAQVLFHNVHLLGVQEALLHQLEDLKDGLQKLKYVGVSRADKKQMGEFSAIFQYYPFTIVTNRNILVG